MRRLLPALLLAVPLALTMSTGLWAQGLYLHVIPTSDAQGVPEVGAASWPLVVTVSRLQDALDQLPVVLDARPVGEPESDGSGRFRIDLKRGLVMSDELRSSDRKASFVIDFHEPSVVSLVDELLDSWSGEALADRPETEALARFVDAAIDEKSMARGWSLASRVAEEGIGDCTEHAVLLTALARYFGYPARVVIGLAVVVTPPADEPKTESRFGVYGHAWTEIYDAGRWRSVDATDLEESVEGAEARHLPLMTLDNEGPGYGMNVMRIQALLPQSVESALEP